MTISSWRLWPDEAKLLTILAIDEAAKFLRLSLRSLYRLEDIPRVRYAGKLVHVQEDLEVCIRDHYLLESRGASGIIATRYMSFPEDRMAR